MKILIYIIEILVIYLYFYTKDNPDKSRIPFYFKEHGNAGCYPELNKVLEQQFGAEQMKKISNQNALEFIERLWK